MSVKERRGRELVETEASREISEKREFWEIKEMQPNSILAVAPSFNSYTSNRFAEIAAKVIREISIEEEVEEGEEEEERDPSFSDSPVRLDQISRDLPPSHQQGATAVAGEGTDVGNEDDDFEFTFDCQDQDVAPISADEIFSNGQIRPILPIFNRDLLVENPSSSIRVPFRKILMDSHDPPSISPIPPSSKSDKLDGLPPGNYCVWKPKSSPTATPDRCKKSNSTGSSKGWRFRHLLHRSSSDGNDTFVFLSSAAVKRGERGEILKEKSSSSSLSGKGKGKAVSAHEMHYVRNRAMREEDRRRSYLPYRQDLVGFFANVNGLSKSFHPF